MRKETLQEKHGHVSEECVQRGQMCPLGNPVVICSWIVLVLDDVDDSLLELSKQSVFWKELIFPFLKNISTIKQNNQKKHTSLQQAIAFWPVINSG